MQMSWDVTKWTIRWNLITSIVERILREAFEEESVEE